VSPSDPFRFTTCPVFSCGAVVDNPDIEQMRAELARFESEQARASARFRWLLILLWCASLLVCVFMCCMVAFASDS
jgi:hypothetical protein